MAVNDKLNSFFISLKNSIRPKSPLNPSKYDPTQALTDLQSHLDLVLSQNQSAIKSGAYTGNSLNSEDYIVQKDPYTSANKIQFEENARAEVMSKATTMKKMDFLFGKGIKTVLDTIDDNFATSMDKSEAVSAILTKQEYLDAKKKVDEVNKRCNVRHWFKAAAFNAKVYGRSALLKEYVKTPDEHPTSVCLLYSKLLGNIYCDKANPSKVLYYEYNSNDNSDYANKIFYEPDDLVYFANMDFGISPNSLGYGYSELEPIKDIAETNRVINEEDNKEYARSRWAGHLLLKLPNLHNAAEVENLLNNFDPAKITAITSDITTEQLEVPTNIADITDLNTQNDRRILRNGQMPTTTFFEEITNRATIQFILHAHKETTVEQERLWIKDTIEPQWIYPIWSKELGFDEYDYEQMQAIDAKLTLEFVEYNFDTFEQKVNVWLPIVQAGYISVERFLEEIGYPELAQEYKQNKQELLKQRIELNPGLGFGQPQFNKFGQQGGGGPGGMKGVKDDPTANSIGKQQSSDLNSGGSSE